MFPPVCERGADPQTVTHSLPCRALGSIPRFDFYEAAPEFEQSKTRFYMWNINADSKKCSGQFIRVLKRRGTTAYDGTHYEMRLVC